jgi:hypothetical protein
LRFSVIETRRTSMKYQLSVEQVRMRIKLKKTTNFVRRLESVRALLPGEASLRVVCVVVIVDSIGFIDQVIHVFGKLDAKKPRRLEIDGDLQPFDRNGFARKFPVTL